MKNFQSFFLLEYLNSFGVYSDINMLKKSALIVFLVLFADQAVKIWIKTHMHLGQEYHILGSWFIIHFTENAGMAFGMELGGKTGKVLLTIFRMIASLCIIGYLVYLNKKKAPIGLIISISLILAGALGNIFDSVFYGMLFSESYPYHGGIATFLPEQGGYSSFLHGKVVDMLYFPVIESRYPNWFPIVGSNPFIFFRPVFNIADSSITIGVCFIILFQKKFFKN